MCHFGCALGSAAVSPADTCPCSAPCTGRSIAALGQQTGERVPLATEGQVTRIRRGRPGTPHRPAVAGMRRAAREGAGSQIEEGPDRAQQARPDAERIAVREDEQAWLVIQVRVGRWEERDSGVRGVCDLYVGSSMTLNTCRAIQVRLRPRPADCVRGSTQPRSAASSTSLRAP